MHLVAASLFTAVICFLLQVAFADVHAIEHHLRKRHVDRAFSSPLGANRFPQQLQKRYDNTRFTLYDAGMGACGKHNDNSDFVSNFLMSTTIHFYVLLI